MDEQRRGVHCYGVDGTLIGKILIPEIVADATFGGAKLNRLFICGTTSLYSIRYGERFKARVTDAGIPWQADHNENVPVSTTDADRQVYRGRVLKVELGADGGSRRLGQC